MPLCRWAVYWFERRDRSRCHSDRIGCHKLMHSVDESRRTAARAPHPISFYFIFLVPSVLIKCTARTAHTRISVIAALSAVRAPSNVPLRFYYVAHFIHPDPLGRRSSKQIVDVLLAPHRIASASIRIMSTSMHGVDTLCTMPIQCDSLLLSISFDSHLIHRKILWEFTYFTYG